MAGGVFFEEKRGLWAVWFSWKKQRKIWRKNAAGEPFYVELMATRFLECIRADVDKYKDRFDPSVYGMDKRILVENAWQTYTEDSPCGKLRKEERDNTFRDFILPYFKGWSIKNIHYIDIDEWIKKLPPRKPSTLRRYVVTFRAFFRYWHTREAIDRIPGFPSIKVPRREIRSLTEIEQAQVFEFIPTHHQPIFGFLRGYGRRPSEACALKRTDIDWQKKIITIHNTKTGQENKLPIGPELEKWLVGSRSTANVTREPYADSRGASKVLVPDTVSVSPPSNLHFVFSTLRGKPYRRQDIYSIWHIASGKANQKYGTPIVSPYEGLRKSFGSQRAGKFDMALISAVMGHADTRTTEQYYAEVKAEKLGGVIELSNSKSTRKSKASL